MSATQHAFLTVMASVAHGFFPDAACTAPVQPRVQLGAALACQLVALIVDDRTPIGENGAHTTGLSVRSRDRVCAVPHRLTSIIPTLPSIPCRIALRNIVMGCRLSSRLSSDANVMSKRSPPSYAALTLAS